MSAGELIRHVQFRRSFYKSLYFSQQVFSKHQVEYIYAEMALPLWHLQPSPENKEYSGVCVCVCVCVCII